MGQDVGVSVFMVGKVTVTLGESPAAEVGEYFRMCTGSVHHPSPLFCAVCLHHFPPSMYMQCIHCIVLVYVVCIYRQVVPTLHVWVGMHPGYLSTVQFHIHVHTCLYTSVSM